MFLDLSELKTGCGGCHNRGNLGGSSERSWTVSYFTQSKQHAGSQKGEEKHEMCKDPETFWWEGNIKQRQGVARNTGL